MRHLAALKQARDTYIRRDNLDRQQRVDAAVALGEWGIFSNRHIAQFTALDASIVNKLIANPDRNGGRLDPEALPTIIEIIWARNRSEMSSELLAKAVSLGVSVNYLAKLTGIPQRTVARRVNVWDGLHA